MCIDGVDFLKESLSIYRILLNVMRYERVHIIQQTANNVEGTFFTIKYKFLNTLEIQSMRKNA